jgi:hypothetical protein
MSALRCIRRCTTEGFANLRLVSAAPSTEAPAAATASRPVSRRRTDLLVAALSLGLALWVTGALWLDPNHRVVRVNAGDQALFEWYLAYGAHSLIHLENPFFTHLLNVPLGVNLAVNTASTVYAYVFAPVTLWLGAPVAFLVILTLNLAATAYAWYWLLSRHLVASRTAAVVGGLFCGFAPGMVSHANAHLNWTAQWIVPLVVWRLLRLRRWRDGIVLGVLVAVMFSIAAEGLFFAALALAVFLACWSAYHRREAAEALPGFLRGLTVTVLVAGLLLAYPLWLHFFGPQRYHGTGFNPRIHAEDLLAFGAFAHRSVAGRAGLDTSLAANPTEEGSFFGVPLLALAVVCVVLLRRRTVVRALAITAAVFAVLSLGPRLKVGGHITGVPLPYALLVKLPVFDAALPARLALVTVPIVGLLLAYGLEVRHSKRWLAAFVVALLPLVPLPVLTVNRDPVPRFFSQGIWREYVPKGGVIVPVPPPSDLLPDGQRWQTYALAARQGEFAVPAGFFLGPGGPDGRGRIGPVPRPTAALLVKVAQTGKVPPISEGDRQRAMVDLRYWRADLVVLGDQVSGAKWTVHRDALLQATTALFGPGEHVAGVTIWRVPA